MNIPKDLKVLGMSNLRTAELLNPSLSTLSQPAFDMGKEAATLLIKMIEKKSYAAANDIIILPNELTLRDSIWIKSEIGCVNNPLVILYLFYVRIEIFEIVNHEHIPKYLHPR